MTNRHIMYMILNVLSVPFMSEIILGTSSRLISSTFLLFPLQPSVCYIWETSQTAQATASTVASASPPGRLALPFLDPPGELTNDPVERSLPELGMLEVWGVLVLCYHLYPEDLLGVSEIFLCHQGPFKNERAPGYISTDAFLAL